MAKVIQIYDDVCGYDLPDTRGKALEIRPDYSALDEVKNCFLIGAVLGFVVRDELLHDYGKWWRIWDTEPTQDDREATPWN